MIKKTGRFFLTRIYWIIDINRNKKLQIIKKSQVIFFARSCQKKTRSSNLKKPQKKMPVFFLLWIILLNIYGKKIQNLFLSHNFTQKTRHCMKKKRQKKGVFFWEFFPPKLELMLPKKKCIYQSLLPTFIGKKKWICCCIKREKSYILLDTLYRKKVWMKTIGTTESQHSPHLLPVSSTLSQ